MVKQKIIDHSALNTNFVLKVEWWSMILPTSHRPDRGGVRIVFLPPWSLIETTLHFIKNLRPASIQISGT